MMLVNDISSRNGDAMSNMGLQRPHRIACEKAILNYVTKFYKEKTGKGPVSIRVKILEDIIEMEATGFLTELERCILTYAEDIFMIEQLRNQLCRATKDEFLREISLILGKEVDLLHLSHHIAEEKTKVTLIIK